MTLTIRKTASLFLTLSVNANFVNGQKLSAGPCRPGEGESLEKNRASRIEKPSVIGARVPCIDGFANEYPCANIDLESFVSLTDMSNGDDGDALGNDIWGWEKDDRAFAIVGMSTGTAFVEVTDPLNPVVIGSLATQTLSSDWRDIKTFQDHAYIVSEAGRHGLQVFDLNELLTATPYTEFFVTNHYNRFEKAHNIFINEDTGFGYVVGISKGPIQCNAGLHMINLADPANPVFAGCYGDRGYTHDVQCVLYNGPDSAYSSKEICFASNENTMDIIDVTDKANPVLISEFTYEGAFYVHQGWLTEDQRYFLIDDELDEFIMNEKSSTVIVDVSNLDDPVFVAKYEGTSAAIDHNQYVLGDFVYQANYRAGLVVLKLTDIPNGNLGKIGYFDTYVDDDANKFNGAWSNYPYLSSGVVLINDIEQGLFIVRADLTAIPITLAPQSTPTVPPTTNNTSGSILERMMSTILDIIDLLVWLLSGFTF